MLASFFMGLIGGQRAMTPLAAMSAAAACGKVPADTRALRIIAHPLVATAAVVLAIGELAGDKQKTAPDRIVPIGLAARFVSSAVAGACLARRRHRWLGAAVGGSTALAASYPGWRVRTAFMPRYGQTRTGLVEDALVVLGAASVVWAIGGPGAG